jgi:creatinine amidohydrolase/Fe(II)-dependent formamide hydrolase-like protein
MKIVETREMIEKCGPYPRGRREVFCFSVGNDFEAHGPALPPETDSIMARAFAQNFSAMYGAYYVAHIPYTSDRVGSIALDWSPCFIEWKDFVEKTVEFIKWHIGSLPWPPERVVIFAGHGGLMELFTMNEELGRRLGVKVRTGFVAGVGPVQLPADLEAREAVEKILAGAGEHAYILEHSAAAALGILDWEQMEMINREAARDPESVLKKWPALAGLGGYLLFGDKDRYQPLRDAGLEFVLNDFLQRKKIAVSKKLGEILLEGALKTSQLYLL